MNAQEMFGHWDSVRRGLCRALDMLSDEQLDFLPREGLWSLGNVACHVARAEDSWIRLAMAGGAKEWPASAYREEDFRSVGALKALLREVHSITLDFLGGVDAEDASRTIRLPWGGSQCTLGWIVWHVLEHEIHHRGEIYLMLGLMGMEAPDV